MFLPLIPTVGLFSYHSNNNNVYNSFSLIAFHHNDLLDRQWAQSGGSGYYKTIILGLSHSYFLSVRPSVFLSVCLSVCLSIHVLFDTVWSHKLAGLYQGWILAWIEGPRKEYL